MKIAIVRPDQHSLMHRVRGTGFYIKNLEESLRKVDKKNLYLSCNPKDIPQDADIIHYPYFEPFFPTLPFLEKRKKVVTIHDLIPFVFPKNFPAGVKGKLIWEVQKRILRTVNAIITDSNSSKKDIQKFTGINEKKIQVVYLAAGEQFRKLNNEKIVESIKNKFKLPDKFVLYVGDVTWNKNLPSLVEAVKSLDLPLVLVGKALVDEDFDKKNPWNRDLSKIIDLSKKYRNVIRLGFLEEDDLVGIYNAATIFAMPSIYEGFGLPILEAMSCGCPVVTTRGGSIPEIAQNAAIYTDPYSVNDIAKGIRKVFFSESLRKDLSKKGLLQAKKFSWEKTAKKTVEVYDSLK